jgi:hypothetical protein
LTRDNLDEKEEVLSNMGITKEYMNSAFTNNQAYMDAIKYWDADKTAWVELFIVMAINTETTNINLYDDQKLLDMMNTTEWYNGADVLEIYKNDNTKFVHAEYLSKGLYLSEYLTIINSKTYVVKFQSSIPFDDSKREVISNVMNTVKFNYKLDDNSGNEEGDGDNVPASSSSSKKGSGDSIVFKALIGGLIGAGAGAILSLIVFLIRKLKNKDDNNNKNGGNGNNGNYYNPYGNIKKDDNNKFINL